MMTPNIYALSSANGKAGLAVIRISGPSASMVIEKMLDSGVQPRKACLREIKHPSSGEILDKGLVIYFKGPHSFTGEDCVELHIHGGQAVTEGVLEALSAMEGFGLAEPGDFSKRAFHNNKLDLVEIEGLADLIDAETETQRQQAFRQMDGALSSIYMNWRAQLIKAMALFEAGIDFVEEEDVPESLIGPVRRELTSLLDALQAHLNDNRKGERLRQGLKLVIIGEPNAGKSSLLNQLTQRRAAIVSDKAGTTRDIIETHLNIGGYPIILTDTAGIRETDEEIEQEGVERALVEAKNADLIIHLIDATSSVASQLNKNIDLNIDSATIRVLNKVDLAKNKEIEIDVDTEISAKTGLGIDRLSDLIAKSAQKLGGVEKSPAITRTRHRQALLDTCKHIQSALDKLGSLEEELIAEDLRQAAFCLGRITGHVDVEDLLDVIFAEFCIGK